MKKKSSNYSTPDSGGWMHRCDELFLARYRGKPCEICSRTEGWDGGKMPSCGHHLFHRKNSRKHRYEPMNMVVLCPAHHSEFATDISPHSIVNELAVSRFIGWLQRNKPDQYKWWLDNEVDARKPFDKRWTYREMYEMLGGKIKKHDKDGKPLAMKYWKPDNHKASVEGQKERGA